MVYETRVGDVFTLGTTSWRVEQITHDQVLVPAPGTPGRLPFWKGDAPGRPLELGRAFGTFVREVGALRPAAARARLREAGLDEFAANNLVSYLAEQQAATGRCRPTRPWSSSGSVTSSVTGVCVCTVPSVPVSSARGRWPSSTRRGSATAWTCRRPRPTTAWCSASRHRVRAAKRRADRV